jgi:hypothetical protein
MGRRSAFPRFDRDAYGTPVKAVLPLLPFLAPATRFIEPCAGDGILVRHLQVHGHICVGAFDIEPGHPSITRRDALTLMEGDVCEADCFITNLPWTRPLLHALITRLRTILPLWTIIDANWAHTRQAGEHMRHCSRLVSIGRVRWIADTPHDGKDDSGWYRFEAKPVTTIFTGRAECSWTFASAGRTA